MRPSVKDFPEHPVGQECVCFVKTPDQGVQILIGLRNAESRHTLSKTETGTGIVTQFQYDITERLTAVSKTDQNGTTPLGQYRYDPFGRRVRKVSQSETLYFHYDDTGLLAEYDAQGNLVREYQYTPGSTWMTKPLFLRDVQTGKVHYYYNSHLGQPLKLFDRQGRTTWEARSQAFGELLVVVEDVENRLRFPGQYFDGESGFYHNFHRDYDPKAGRYVQRDPIGLDGGMNFYSYALLNPVFNVDYDGLRVRKSRGARGPKGQWMNKAPKRRKKSPEWLRDSFKRDAARRDQVDKFIDDLDDLKEYWEDYRCHSVAMHGIQRAFESIKSKQRYTSECELIYYQIVIYIEPALNCIKSVSVHFSSSMIYPAACHIAPNGMPYCDSDEGNFYGLMEEKCGCG